MTRPLRVDVADGWYHCMHRGIEQRTIFADARDNRHFLELLEEVTKRFRIRVHAYCLLGNHYHAILQTPDANLSQAMQWLGLSYSSWFNARYNRVGPLFQGRFKSVPVEDGAWVYELSMYVHLNPVRTMGYGLDKRRQKAEKEGMSRPPTREEIAARLKQLREYPWSSYGAYAGYRDAPKWLSTATILRRAAREKAHRKKKYREAVQGLLSRGVQETRVEEFREVLGIGSAEFTARLRKGAGFGKRETERRGRLRRRVSYEQVIEAVEQVKGEASAEWLARHGDWGKWLVVRLARRYTGMTLRQIGERMGGKDYAAVSAGLRRFENQQKVTRSLRSPAARADRMLNV